MGINDATIGGDIGVKLTETFAGGQLLELCSACVTSITGGNTIKSNTRLDINRGEQLVVVGSEGSRGGTGASNADHTASPKALYKVLHTIGYIGSIVTEGAGATTFQYVSQCSNRGTCDSPPACAS